MFLWNFNQRTGSTVALLGSYITRIFLRFGLWCLMPLSTIFQLYRGGKKYPYKQRYIAGSAKCSKIPLSKLLTSINIMGQNRVSALQ